MSYLELTPIVLLATVLWLLISGRVVPPHVRRAMSSVGRSAEFERLRREALAELDDVDRAFGLEVEGPANPSRRSCLMGAPSIETVHGMRVKRVSPSWGYSVPSGVGVALGPCRCRSREKGAHRWV